MTIEALAIHDGPHRRVSGEPLGIIHVFVSGQAAIDRLTKQAGQQVARVLAAPQVRQRRAAQISQVKNLVQLAIGQEPSVGGDLATVEFELQAVVEIEPIMRRSGFTRRVRRV